ncbi:MAG: tetratricopeptide repeat protein [Verrucomicrobiota bacterium]
MHLRTVFLPLIPLVCLVAHAQESPPIEAQKYHEALLKHPHNPTVFSRFYDAWIDAQSIESLEAFLKQRAETHGGIDYAILARYQLRRGQDPNALESLKKAIESLPNDPALLLERANLLVRSNDFVQARNDLEIVSKLGSEALSIEASKLIGKSYLREGNPEEAIKTWEKIITNHPKNEDLLEDLVELASSAEQPEQALKYSQKLIVVSADPYKKALRLIRRGDLLAKSGENDQAIALWTETLSQTGEGSWLEREIFACIEQSFRRLDRIDLLTAKLEELATAHPRRLLIHRELAKLEASSGNIDSAIGRFRGVLRRSPGELELREEFIRLLINAERFDDASVELGKMITTTPNNPELYFRLAELAFQKSQLNRDLDKQATSSEILKSLEKAREFLDPTEASGLRIANLMIRYGLEENGENLLEELSTKPDASAAPAEALAAQYTRTKRPAKALEILTELTKSPDPETFLRATNAMAPLTQAEIPFNILVSRLPDFPNNNSYIAALIQASLAAKKPADAIPSAMKLVRSSKLSSEIQDATKLASTVITAAEKAPDIIVELSNNNERSTPETCLLTSLLEIQKEHDKTDSLFQNATDPNLLLYHSSLLSIRGDFKAAIASLNRLAETSADNSASYFKELSDLQLRSGDFEACLKTIEQWKIAAPTDKTPWTIATRLLRESGKYPEAIETTRRALSRFSNDEDLTAGLADLYQQIGTYTEAERIYWKLYDQAPDPTSQSRWAARLSTLAHSIGKTEELKENFVQRSRSNNQSIGPILSLVELARVTNDRESQLENLYQALRIKPKDIEIRLLIAAAEKQFGNLDKQLSVLNEAIDQDTTGRIRTSLAQAYIEQGKVMKGMHMLRALDGERASDPRLIETAANSIANNGMIAEAIQYLEEALPADADWRARFLLADLLQKDGREARATEILITLLEAKNEIPGLISNINRNQAHMRQGDPAGEYQLNSLINAVSQEVYNSRNSQHSYGFQQRALPSTSDEVRFRSKILLAFIANIGNPALNEKIVAANIEDLPFITDIIANHAENGINYLPLIEKHPTRGELVRLVIQQGRFRDPNTGQPYPADQTSKILQKLLESPTIDADTRIQLTLTQLLYDPKNDATWETLFTLFGSQSNPESNSNLSQIYYQLYNLIAEQKANIPPKQIPKIKEVLLSKSNPNGSHFSQGSEIAIFALLGEIDPWIDAINKTIRAQQTQIAEQLKTQKPSGAIRSIGQYGVYLQIPEIRNLPLTSIIIHHLQNITSNKIESSRNQAYGTFAAKDLIKHLDRFESPVLRAWIAILSEDEKAIKKTLSVTPSEIEANDFTILKIWLDIDAKRYPEACRGLHKLSSAPSHHPNLSYWAKTSFLAIVSLIPEEKRSEFLTPAREVIDSFTPLTTAPSPWQGNDGHSQLVEISKKLGFEDLVKKFTPPAHPTSNPAGPRHNPVKPASPSKATIGRPAILASSKSNQSQPIRPINPIDRVNQFSREGKHTAAAHELLTYIQSQKKQGYDATYIISNVKLTPEVRKEILTITDSANNPSLSKRLDFADLCIALNENEKALNTLRTLAQERPFDASININLAFNLPAKEIDTAAKLLKENSDSAAFYLAINKSTQRHSRSNNNEISFQHFTLLMKFLEIADPAKVNPQAYREINNSIYYFISGNNLSNISSLIRSDNSKAKDTPEITKHREISRNLSFAMLRHPLLAESGFRIIRAAKWIEDPNKLDELAKNTLLLENHNLNFRNHISNNIQEFSAADWICKRIHQAKSPDEIIPPDFLTAIEKNDPQIATLLRSFSTLKSTKDIGEFWDSGAMVDDNSQTSRSTIQQALLEKIASTPGAIDFFSSRIKTFTPEMILKSTSPNTGESNLVPFLRAAVVSCKNQNETTVKNLCSAIIKAIYGEKPNFSNISTRSIEYQNLSRANSVVDSMFRNYEPDPVTAIHIFQTFDSHRIPLQNNQWMQNIFRKTEFESPEEGIKFLETIGFLKDSASWKPLAYSTITTEYDNTSGAATQTITRQILNETIIQSFNHRFSSSDFFNLLEQHKPQTFGSLITAATFTRGTERNRLALKAFEHAANHLAKASPKQLEDFSLLAPYLPYHSISTLPPQLQAKVKELHGKKIALIQRNIDEQFTYISKNPSENPFNQLQNYITQLAQYDIDKAIETFQRADSVYLANIAHFNTQQSLSHEDHLQSIIQSLSSSEESKPESGLLFYRAIRNSPQSHRYGIGSKNYGSSYLLSLGNTILNNSPPRATNTAEWLRPWMIIGQLPKELHNDALAAITCYILSNSYPPAPDKAAEELSKVEDLSDKTRELALTCATINYSRNNNKGKREPSEQAFMNLLKEPIFNADARSQIAFTGVTSNPQFLSSPKVAEAFADFFATYCAREYSAVNDMTLNIISQIATIEPIQPAQAHLKKINEAFWDNANSGKIDIHRSIDERYTSNLFIAAIRVGDQKNSETLLPHVKSSMMGDISTITSLLLSDQFQLANELLPDESTDFKRSRNLSNFSNELKQKLTEFTNSSTTPERAMRFECQLLQSFTNKNSSPTLENIKERKTQLVANYLKSPPKNLKTRIEILSYFISGMHSVDPAMENEICDIASKLDPKHTLLTAFEKSKSGNNGRVTEPHSYKIICAAAMIHFLNGDPTLFNSTCDALTDLLKQSDSREGYTLRSFVKPFIEPALLATAQAVTENKTKSFQKIIPSLQNLIIEISKTSNSSTEDLINFVTLYDFICHWENQPEKSTELIKKLNLQSNQSILNSFSSPRISFIFFDRYRTINQSQNLPRMGDKPIEFVSAILSRESLADIYVISNSWLTNVDSGKVYQEVMNMGKTPPESASSSGKTYLKYHAVTRDIHAPEERIAAYLTLLKEIPASQLWDEIRISSKLRLANEMLKAQKNIAEIREIFDSIDPKTLPDDHKNHFESLRKNIKNAEAKPE